MRLVKKQKKIVLKYAQDNNYHPNTMAQSLKKGHSKSIGIVLSSVDNQFFSQVIDGIESEAYSQGYNVIFTQTHESYELERQNISHLTHRSIDGLLISLSTETTDVEHLTKLQAQGLPIVLFDRISDEIDTHKVVADNFKGAYEATKHLIDAGYRHIAHVTSTSYTSVTSERLMGYKQALLDNDIEIDELYIKYCHHGGMDLNENKQLLSELLALPVRPDAILTAWDKITTTTLSILRKLAIRIPEDIALLGFTNTLLADDLNPSLSAVQQPAFEMGRKSTEMLLSLINSKYPVTEFETIILPTKLFIRNSSSNKLSGNK